MADKPTRKELREPDEFITFTQRVIDFVQAQKMILIFGALAVVVVILGVFGWQWFVENSTQKASSAFVDARKILDAPVIPREDAEETSQIDGTYSSEQDKYQAALSNFQIVKDKHPSSATASLATYFIGECYWKLGEPDKAVAAFEEYLRAEGKDGELAAFAVEGIAATLEDKGDIDQAKQHYKRLTEEPFASQRARGLYHLARLEQKQGREEEASRQFQALLKEFPDTPLVREIQDRLSILPVVDLPDDEPGAGAPDAPGPGTVKSGEEAAGGSGKNG